MTYTKDCQKKYDARHNIVVCTWSVNPGHYWQYVHEYYHEKDVIHHGAKREFLAINNTAASSSNFGR